MYNQSTSPFRISLRPSFIFFHPRLCLLNGLFPSIFPFKRHEFLISFRHATCPTHLTCLDLVAQIFSGQDYKPCRPTYILCLFLISPVTYVNFRWECFPSSPSGGRTEIRRIRNRFCFYLLKYLFISTVQSATNNQNPEI